MWAMVNFKWKICGLGCGLLYRDGLSWTCFSTYLGCCGHAQALIWALVDMLQHLSGLSWTSSSIDLGSCGHVTAPIWALVDMFRHLSGL
jgi:hypothetical protein